MLQIGYAGMPKINMQNGGVWANPIDQRGMNEDFRLDLG
jgi:hypothetical protein